MTTDSTCIASLHSPTAGGGTGVTTTGDCGVATTTTAIGDGIATAIMQTLGAVDITDCLGITEEALHVTTFL